MINESFYPTPVEVIDKMVQGLSQRIDVPAHEERIGRHMRPVEGYTWYRLPGERRRLLEPSAGKGEIVDRMIKKYRVQRSKVSCIEIDPTLQATLTGKGYQVIDSDFLNFSDPYHFDIIVMNPPFTTGAKHLLKAWEIVDDGGHIACLLNAETIRNPHTKERQLLECIIEQHGRTEEIGQCFKQAERHTDVECVIVWLAKPESEKVANFDDIEFEHDQTHQEAEFSPNPLANRNVIASLVAQYKAARKTLEEREQVNKKIGYYTRGVRFSIDEDHRSMEEQFEELKASFWKYIFERTGIGKATTSQF